MDENKDTKLNDAIKYKGTVKVSIVDKKGKIRKKQYYNQGKLPLFTSLCRALAGYDIDKYKPFYLMLYTLNEQTGEYERALASNIVYSSTPNLYLQEMSEGAKSLNSKNCNIIEYVFTIPVTVIARNNQNNQEITITKLALLNAYGNECATIILDQSDPDPSKQPIEIQTAINTSNILVEWQLKFMNLSE